MKTRIFLFFLSFVAPSGSALAASRTVTLDVKNMTCAVCPLTVKKALEGGERRHPSTAKAKA